jgi:2-iminobutanoate/2-iminopropanoate deaminase
MRRIASAWVVPQMSVVTPASRHIGRRSRIRSAEPSATSSTSVSGPQVVEGPQSVDFPARRLPGSDFSARLDTSAGTGSSWGAMDLEFLMVSGAPPPPPTAPYSHAVRAGEFLFVTGQLPADPATGQLVGGGITEQTHRVMRNLQAVLAGAGSSLARIVFARVYLVNFADYPAMNAVYASYFAPGRLPGRTCVGVTGLALGALVEIDLVVRS